MLGQLHNVTTVEHDDGSRVEDLFRRAAFSWALSTKKLVESSNALGTNTKVAHAALVDIEYARDLLDKLFMPKASKTPAAFADSANTLTAEQVRDCVAGLATRIMVLPADMLEVDITPKPGQVYMMVDGEWTWVDPPKPSQVHRGADLSAPVHSKNGKMRWAEVDCPSCSSKATQRCKRPDGAFMEKPHKARLEVWVK